jgi:beta-glucanase (GH16 family)
MRTVIISFLLITFFSCKEKAKEEKLIFFEDFKSEVLDETHWNYDLGNGCPNLCGWGNNERQFYTKKNIRLDNGNLIITATKTDSIYESGKIHTKSKIEFQYGTVEVRAKLPSGHGLWPAIWMLGNDINEIGWPACGEIDIMEYVGREPNIIYTSLHTPDSHGNTVNSKKTNLNNAEEGFHTYKTVWTKDFIEFYIDDTKVYTFSPEIKDDKTWPYNKPFYIILNLAIGGNFGGPEVDDSIFPQEFIIDYIKVYSL